jgi:hypothetical protein
VDGDAMKLWIKFSAAATQLALAFHEPHLAGIFFVSFVWGTAEFFILERKP